jgi:peptide-methionine (R)-S-oxide reductase
MEDASLAMTLARCRIVIGVAAVVSPRLATRVMSGSRRPEGIAPLFARMLGGRDIALGLGTVIAVDRGKPVRGWLEASALADAVDCIACVLGRGDMSPGAFCAATGFGAASTLLGGLLSRRLDPPPAAHPGQPEAVATGHSAESIGDS